MKIYVREVRWYIYMSLRGQVCARVIATPSHNNAPGQCCDNTSNSLNAKELIKKVVVFKEFKYLRRIGCSYRPIGLLL